MWIVRLALRRPYTVAVMSFLMLLLGILSLTRMVVDIFPNVDIPVVMVVWNYPGLAAEDMERRVTLISERAYSTTVNGIERIESQSTSGIGMLKIYFRPGSDIGAGIAQISSVSSTILHNVPPGMGAPNVIQFNASNVPVAQLTVSSESIPEERLYDYGLNFIRVRLFTIPGLSTPAPFGGKTREIVIDINPQALSARGLSPQDVVNALQASNVIVPAGTARIGKTEYNILLNSSPDQVKNFAQIPLKIYEGQPVLLGDVAKVMDGYAAQTNIARVNGKRATYLAILKHADASTLAVIDATKETLPMIKAAAPQGMEFKIDFDQSIFVRAAISGVLREAVLSSALVSLMILVFLGSWRSTIIVCTSIPLAIFTSIVCLNLGQQTINIMTLGGLALAIGMLVDDATVEVENIHRNVGMGKPLTVAILNGAQQIATPAIVATLAICIVFFPVVLLVGPAKYLFTPLALSVVFAMLASYLLSRTLVPVLFRKLMKNEVREHHEQKGQQGQQGQQRQQGQPSQHHSNKPKKPEKPKGALGRFGDKFNEWRDRNFDRFREAYGRTLDFALDHRALVLIFTGLFVAISMALVTVIGTDFFPTADAGLMKLHFRAPPGTRLEQTEKLVTQVEARIREVVPAKELVTINDNIGVPTAFNVAFVQTDNFSSMDAEILIALNEKHHPTEGYMRKLREALPKECPACSFYFQPADIVNQVLNFGLSAPIDIQIEHPRFEVSYPVARRLRDALSTIPGVADAHIIQIEDYPSLMVNVDRVRAAQVNVSQRDVANSLLVALSSSSLVAPSFFLNPENNVNYFVAVKEPLPLITSVQSLLNIPVTTPTGSGQSGESSPNSVTPSAGASMVILPSAPANVPAAQAQTLGNLATVHPKSSPNEISHYTVQRILDVAASPDGRDLGSIVNDIRKKIAGLGKLPDNLHITIRGQNEVMERSFRMLGLGLILAVILVYLLMVVLFQSYLDPFIIMFAVPGALAGIMWMLMLTGTTINVESLMGAIMAVGIAVSNSILMVSFANEVRSEDESISSTDAAKQAGRTRLRPVLMTALAMILGMLPMAFGMGEGGEQNAPLGRAVIGGLLVATFTTLFVVPVIYSLLRKKLPTEHLLEKRFAAEERGEEVDDDDDAAPPEKGQQKSQNQGQQNQGQQNQGQQNQGQQNQGQQNQGQQNQGQQNQDSAKDQSAGQGVAESRTPLQGQSEEGKPS